jgi:antitoxin component of MazEF toxin-antitoxin module
MVQAVIGKWGKNLAVRLPVEVVKAAGLHTGERVDIETRGPDIIIRRSDADALADAQAAAEEIWRERELHPLDEAEILDMLKEGRRG